MPSDAVVHPDALDARPVGDRRPARCRGCRHPTSSPPVRFESTHLTSSPSICGLGWVLGWATASRPSSDQTGERDAVGGVGDHEPARELCDLAREVADRDPVGLGAADRVLVGDRHVLRERRAPRPCRAGIRSVPEPSVSASFWTVRNGCVSVPGSESLPSVDATRSQPCEGGSPLADGTTATAHRAPRPRSREQPVRMSLNGQAVAPRNACSGPSRASPPTAMSRVVDARLQPATSDRLDAGSMKPVHVGCSGWNYRDWRETVYPEGAAGAALARALRRRSSTPSRSTTPSTGCPTGRPSRAGREQTPAGLRLRGQGEPLPDAHQAPDRHGRRRRALLRADRAAASTAGKLGPVLWQLPGNFRRDDERLGARARAAARRAGTASSSATRAGSPTRSTSCCARTASRS